MLITITQGPGHMARGFFLKDLGKDRIAIRVGRKILTGKVVE